MSFTASSLGGKYKQSLSANNLPKVTGQVSFHGSSQSTNVGTPSGCFTRVKQAPYYFYGFQMTGAVSTGILGFDNGGKNESHNNIQPYISVYMWKRTA